MRGRIPVWPFSLVSPIGLDPPLKEQTTVDDLEQTIRQNAEGPAEARGDSTSIKQHSLSEQIAADRYLEGKKATKKKGLGIAVKKLVPPGAD